MTSQPDVKIEPTDTSALERAVREHGMAMLAVARRLLGSEDDARECVQDAYLTAFAKAESFEARSAYRTWLHRIVVNTALGLLRKRKHRNSRSIDSLMPEFDGNGCRIEPMWQFDEPMERAVERAAVREAVRTAIDRLPDIYRVVLVLRDIEEYSAAEVAELLDTNVPVVKTRLHRARAALKKCWKINGTEASYECEWSKDPQDAWRAV